MGKDVTGLWGSDPNGSLEKMDIKFNLCFIFIEILSVTDKLYLLFVGK